MGDCSKKGEVSTVGAMQFSGGDCTRTLDAKNRIVMPPAFKSGLSAKTFCVICFPGDNYLRVYNEEDLNSIFNEMFFTVGGNKEKMRRQRYALSRMIKCELDSQNRFTLSQKLIDLAGIDKEIRMIGVGTRIELWNPELLEADLSLISDEDFEDMDSGY